MGVGAGCGDRGCGRVGVGQGRSLTRMAIRVWPARSAGKGSHRIERGAMNVYVESNFVLEQALEQEQCESCEQLIGLASAGSVQLVIPAFSLAEPHGALLRTKNARSRLRSELLPHLRELARSRAYREVSANFDELADLLLRSGNANAKGCSARLSG